MGRFAGRAISSSRYMRVPFEIVWLCLSFALIPVIAPTTNPLYWQLVIEDVRRLFGC